MQVMFVRFIQQIKYGWVLRIDGGTDAALWFVQHEISLRLACLKDLAVEGHAAEFPYIVMRVACDLTIHCHTAADQRQTHVLAVETRQVAEEAVKTHGDGDRKVMRAHMVRDLAYRLAQRCLLDTCAARAQAGLVADFVG